MQKRSLKARRQAEAQRQRLMNEAAKQLHV